MKVRYYGFMHSAFSLDYYKLRLIVEGFNAVKNKANQINRNVLFICPRSEALLCESDQPDIFSAVPYSDEWYTDPFLLSLLPLPPLTHLPKGIHLKAEIPAGF